MSCHAGVSGRSLQHQGDGRWAPVRGLSKSLGGMTGHLNIWDRDDGRCGDSRDTMKCLWKVL